LTHGIGVMGYGSLGHGLLTGAFTAATTFDPARDWRGNGVAFGQPIFRADNFQTNLRVIERLRHEVAEPRGVPLSQIALAWVLGHPAVSTALVGARTPAAVDANDAGPGLGLSAAERARHYRERFEALEARVADIKKMKTKSHLLCPWVLEIAEDPHILDIFEDLVGPNLRCWSMAWRVKKADGQTFAGWHQDSAYGA